MAVVWNPKTKLCILHYTNLFTVGCLCHVMISRLASRFATHSWLLSPRPYWSAGRHLLSSRRPHHWKLFIYCVIDEKMTRLLPFACSSNFSHRFLLFLPLIRQRSARPGQQALCVGAVTGPSPLCFLCSSVGIDDFCTTWHWKTGVVVKLDNNVEWCDTSSEHLMTATILSEWYILLMVIEWFTPRLNTFQCKFKNAELAE